MTLVPCPKCNHPRPTEGIGDGEIAALLRERDSYREDALRYRALRDSGRYAPDPFGNGWALSMNHGVPTDELDAAADEIRSK